LALSVLWLASSAHAMAGAGVPGAMPWWFWPLALIVTCCLLGIVAVPAGIGGGTLFVPIVGGLFPFHLDFVRGAGLLAALARAQSAGPMLLRGGRGSLRLALLGSASGITLLAMAMAPKCARRLAERGFALAMPTHPQNPYCQAGS
jgi:uncharacterized membrane protein YfcA